MLQNSPTLLAPSVPTWSPAGCGLQPCRLTNTQTEHTGARTRKRGDAVSAQGSPASHEHGSRDHRQAVGGAGREDQSQQGHLSHTTEPGGRPAALGQEQPCSPACGGHGSSNSRIAPEPLSGPACSSTCCQRRGCHPNRPGLSCPRNEAPSIMNLETRDCVLAPAGMSPSGRWQKHPVELLRGCTCV